MKKWSMILAACAIPLFLTACNVDVDVLDSDDTTQTSAAFYGATQAIEGFSLDIKQTNVASNAAIHQAAKMVIRNLAALHKHSALATVAYAPGSTPNQFSIDVTIKGHDAIRFNCNAKAEQKIMKVVCQQSS